MSKNKPPTPPAAACGATPAGTTTTACPNPCATPQKSPKGGNTTVQVDNTARTVTIRSNLEYSGPDATTAYANSSRDAIVKMWSGQTTINGQPYDVIVDPTVNVVPPGTPQTGYDSILVDRTYHKTATSAGRSDQSLFGAGVGHQSEDALTNPKFYTSAHEYGHTLGLPDEYHDTPTGSMPNDPSKTANIMTQTWDDPGGVAPHPYPDHYQQILKNYGCI